MHRFAFLLITHEYFYCKEKKTSDKNSRTLQKLFTNLSIFSPNFRVLIQQLANCLHSQDERRGSLPHPLESLAAVGVPGEAPELGSLSSETHGGWNGDHHSPGRVKRMETNLGSMNSSFTPYTRRDETLPIENSSKESFPFHKRTRIIGVLNSHLCKWEASLKLKLPYRWQLWLHVNALNNLLPLCVPCYVCPRENVTEFTPK